MPERPRPRIDLQAVFGLASGDWDWRLGIRAAVAMGVAFAVAAALVEPAAGVVAALGSFTVLYERSTPYARRAVTLSWVAVGFVVCVAIGSLSASLSPWLGALAIGGVAGLATWVCQSLRVDKPAAFMFILVCAIATIMPGGVAALPTHVGLAALGAGVGWVTSMSGALVGSRQPEFDAVSHAFREIAELMRAVGTTRFDHAQHEASVAVAEAWRVMLLAQTRGYRDTPAAARLRALLRWVSDIHLSLTDLALARHEPMPDEVAAFCEQLATAVARPQLAPAGEDLDALRHGLRPRTAQARVYSALSRAAQVAGREEHDAQGPGLHLHDRRYPPVWDALRSGLRTDNLIRPTALRMAITVAAAGVVGLALDLERFYWISLTAATVLQGGNVVLTANRSTQRSLGTIVGVFIAVGILAQHPPLWAVIAIAAVAHGLAQATMPRNFLYASILLTPMALILAYTAQPYPVAELAQDRVVDTVLGAVVGVAGALLLWRSASAARLPQVIDEVVQQARTTVAAVLDPEEPISPRRAYQLRRDLRGALLSLRGVYESAIGDVPRARGTQPLWPVVIATQRVGYLALAMLAQSDPPPASYITRQRVDLAFAELASALRERRSPRLGALPRLTDYPRLQMELRALAQSMRTAVAEDEHTAALERQRREQQEQRRAREEPDADL
ncbi:FUSC family protein [Lipingzhangella sp. LS1_29]|uniref:FUSC family protein n=1 Tax=Lipingzhangella rawalii TaxID=2055835 RepID=A0ABU2H1I6_9ACTN|nr:FUSC family protein [Lipingzhangella rawalii]MDS1269166.1 FUSC family protein [Lipingzhangella rawalii]